jgi:transposase
MARRSSISPEVRERAVRLVFEQESAHRSEWAAICSVAEKIGRTPETLRKWVRQAQRDAGSRPGVTTSERDRLKEPERENLELKRAKARRRHPKKRPYVQRSADNAEVIFTRWPSATNGA